MVDDGLCVLCWVDLFVGVVILVEVMYDVVCLLDVLVEFGGVYGCIGVRIVVEGECIG